MKRTKFFMLVTLMFMTTSVAFAEKVAADRMVVDKRAAVSTNSNGQSCVMEETSTVNVSFNGVEADLSKIGTLMEARQQEMLELAKQAGAPDSEVQNMNYSVNSNSHGGCGMSAGAGGYQMSGNISLTVKPGDKATALAALLAEKKYNVNLNVNAYRRCQ